MNDSVKRILLIEDSLADAGLVREALEEAAPNGFELIHTTRVESGVAMAAGVHLEAAILDMNLPDAQPLEGLRRFREAYPDLPVIVLTGMDDRSLAVRALQAGAQDYLVKRELGSEELLRSLRLAVQAKRASELEREITEQKRVEKAIERMRRDYELILESVGEGVIRLDLHGRITFANTTAVELLGWDADVLIGQPAHSAIHHTTPAGGLYSETDCPIEAAHREGRISRVDDEVFWRHDGTSFSVEYIAAPIREGDRIVGTVCSFRDTSERWRAEHERQALEARLRQAERLESIGQLAGGIAHDFNNLLAVILNYASFVAEGVTDDRLREDVEQITKAAERAASLTHQLLIFSRREVVRAQVLDLNAVVADTERLLRRTIGENIDMRVRRSAGLWPVMGDLGQIEQILMNLVINARDAMAAGGTLTIETANADLDEAYVMGHVGVEPGRYVRLTVADTGAGMSAEVAAHAFEPFFTTKPKGQGTGLGLPTVYGIATQAGGYVGLYSELGRGTVVKVYLPASGDPQSPNASERVHHPASRGETVLVVEDEEAVRAVAIRVLEQNGYRVLEAPSPEEALLISGTYEGPIDLLLTDIVMPGMSGPEVARRLATIRPDLRVVYMSGYSHDIVDQQGALDAPLVEKPFTQETLLRQVREVLARPAGAGQVRVDAP